MKKLKLKHLANHALSKGLVYCDNSIWRIRNIDFESGIIELTNDSLVGGYEYNIQDIQLILRPLSDLTKEIEVDGNTFVLIDKIKNRWGYEIFEYQGYINYAPCFKLEDNEPALLHLPYCFIELFLKYYFDIYGLIEKGLAIDINTIE